MSALKYNLVSVGDEANLTLFVDGEMHVASSTHPNWQKIVAAVLVGDKTVVDLFDVSKTVAKKFERVSGRATVANGRLYFDGDELHGVLADEVVRFLDEGVDDWKPLVAFLEKVEQNPQEHSKEQLFTWLKDKAFTLTEDGDIVGYKGVVSGDDGVYTSVHSGTAIVNGVVVTGKVPQKVGDLVEMPRSEVAFDPATSCSSGLHVANWSYAKGWGDQVLTVAVNPRDVVSVPSDSNFAKVRVCRYVITGVTNFDIPDLVQKSVFTYSDSLDEDEADWDDDDVPYCDYCGDSGHEEDDCDDKAQDEEDERLEEEATERALEKAAADARECDELNEGRGKWFSGPIGWPQF